MTQEERLSPEQRRILLRIESMEKTRPDSVAVDEIDTSSKPHVRRSVYWGQIYARKKARAEGRGLTALEEEYHD